MSDPDAEILSRLGSGLDRAVQGRHLPNPVDAVTNPNQTDSSAYIRAVRARLIELGYLATGSKSANRNKIESDDNLTAKVRRFQREAGIKEDGWVGPKTWSVLECLVSFESHQDPGKWQTVWPSTVALLTNPALLRGVYCRLYALGFFPDWDDDRINTRTAVTPSENAKFQQAIESFCTFAKTAKLVPAACEGLSLELLEAMYQYDQLVDAVGQSATFDALNAAFPQNIYAIARIELWLLGYDIEPGKDSFVSKPQTRRGGNTRRRKRVSRTDLAIKNFCVDNKRAKPDFVAVETVTAGLMQAFAEITSEPEKDIALGGQLNATVNKILANRNAKKTLNRQFKAIANGVFDGIKRVVRWLFRLVRKVVKFTKEFVANVVRFISQKARKYYVGIAKAVDIVFSGMGYLRGSVSHYSQPAKVVFSHDNDFDQMCLITPQIDPGLLHHDLSRNRFRSRLYAASLNIISHLIRIGYRILRAVSSPAGWLFGLLSLSNLAHSVKAIKQQIDLVRSYELQIEHRQALFRAAIS
ncbi:MAG: peptidoglycan-binding domain-containing protein [Pseudomonadota bacterium]